MDGLQIIQMIESIGALCGFVSLILYFPAKKKDIKAKTETRNIQNLTEIVNRLREEAKVNEKHKPDDRDRILRSEKKIDTLQEDIHKLRKDGMYRDEAMFAVVKCEYTNGNDEKCPIYMKARQLKINNHE